MKKNYILYQLAFFITLFPAVMFSMEQAESNDAQVEQLNQTLRNNINFLTSQPNYPLKSPARYLIPLFSHKELENLLMIFNRQSHQPHGLTTSEKQNLFLKRILTQQLHLKEYVDRTYHMCELVNANKTPETSDMLMLQKRIDDLLITPKLIPNHDRHYHLEAFIKLGAAAVKVNNGNTSLPPNKNVYQNTDQDKLRASWYICRFMRDLPNPIIGILLHAIETLTTAYNNGTDIDFNKEYKSLMQQLDTLSHPNNVNDKTSEHIISDLKGPVAERLKELLETLSAQELAQICVISTYPYLNPQESRTILALKWILANPRQGLEERNPHKTHLVDYTSEILQKRYKETIARHSREASQFLILLKDVLNNKTPYTQDLASFDISEEVMNHLQQVAPIRKTRTIEFIDAFLDPKQHEPSRHSPEQPLKKHRSEQQSPTISTNNNNYSDPVYTGVISMLIATPEHQRSMILYNLSNHAVCKPIFGELQQLRVEHADVKTMYTELNQKHTQLLESSANQERQITYLNQQLKDVSSERDRVGTEFLNAKELKKAVEQQLVQSQHQHEAALAQLHTRLQQATQVTVDQESQCKQLQQDLKESQEYRSKLLESYNTKEMANLKLKKQLETLQQAKDTVEQQLHEAQALKGTLVQQLQTAQKQYTKSAEQMNARLQELQTTYDQKQQEYVALQNSNGAQHQQIDTLKAQLQAMEEKITSLDQTDYKILQEQYHQLIETNERLLNGSTNKSLEIEKLSQENQKLHNYLSEAHISLKNSDIQITELMSTIQNINNAIAQVQQQLQEHEQFVQSYNQLFLEKTNLQNQWSLLQYKLQQIHALSEQPNSGDNQQPH